MTVARIGINPTRKMVSEYRPARVTVAMITYLPHLEGYFRHRLEVLRLSLGSLLANTPEPYDLLVFDNGSCSEVVDYLTSLRDSGKIRFLILAGENIGKIGAFQVIFGAAPGELIAYSDDDILYCPGWLAAQLRLFEAFPQAGMVSGTPVRNGSRYAIGAIERLAQNPPPGLELRRARVIPAEWEAEWALSTGRDPQEAQAALANHAEWVLSKAGLEAIGTANHYQFIAPKKVLLEAMPSEWSGRLMGQMIELDEAIDRADYLRLSPLGRYNVHIGNLISPAMAEEARQLGLDLSASPASTTAKRRKLARQPLVRRVLVAAYNRLFNLLNDL